MKPLFRLIHIILEMAWLNILLMHRRIERSVLRYQVARLERGLTPDELKRYHQQFKDKEL